MWLKVKTRRERELRLIAEEASEALLSMDGRGTGPSDQVSKTISVSTQDVVKHLRRRSSLTIELGMFVAKVITKFLHETSRVGVGSNIQLLTMLTQKVSYEVIDYS